MLNYGLILYQRCQIMTRDQSWRQKLASREGKNHSGRFQLIRKDFLIATLTRMKFTQNRLFQNTYGIIPLLSYCIC